MKLSFLTYLAGTVEPHILSNWILNIMLTPFDGFFLCNEICRWDSFPFTIKKNQIVGGFIRKYLSAKIKYRRIIRIQCHSDWCFHKAMWQCLGMIYILQYRYWKTCFCFLLKMFITFYSPFLNIGERAYRGKRTYRSWFRSSGLVAGNVCGVGRLTHGGQKKVSYARDTDMILL